MKLLEALLRDWRIQGIFIQFPESALDFEIRHIKALLRNPYLRQMRFIFVKLIKNIDCSIRVVTFTAHTLDRNFFMWRNG